MLSTSPFSDLKFTAPIQRLDHANPYAVTVDVKRLDLIHPYISGNKFFKLKYNIQYALQHDFKGILSFGGAYSNHIVALAHACHVVGLNSIGLIRGEELAQQPLNAYLTDAQQHGMQLQFISRTEYRLRSDDNYLTELQQRFPQYFILPEGGTNPLAIQGCKEILTPTEMQQYDVVCCAVGTGGTLSGLIESDFTGQILGFSALKGNFLTQTVQHYTQKQPQKQNWRILDDYCMGGYAKTTTELLDFIQQMNQHYQLPLEPIYTGKLFFGLFDLIQSGYFNYGSRILAIHSGGLYPYTSFEKI